MLSDTSANIVTPYFSSTSMSGGYQQYGYQQQYPQYQQYAQQYGQQYGAPGGQEQDGMFGLSYTMIAIIFLVICCCCSVCCYMMRSKCGDDSTTIGWINSKWWMWLVAIIPIPPIFPFLLIGKVILWFMCNFI